jgi:8-oxo-dGTP pyrophosphatase MutT (NUDIX family)
MQDPLHRLNALGRIKDKHPTIPPKDAATLIILDRTGPELKVLLGRRHEGHAFMPGKFVFPGGRVEKADALMRSTTELDAEGAAKLMRGTSARKARALALAAVRETFEETGLMLGVKREPLSTAPRGLWSAFADAGIYPDLGALHFVARAITPPGLSRRFDTRFFAVDAQAIAHRVDGIVGPQAELVELVWASIEETRGLGLHAITATILDELQARAAAGMEHGLPVPLYRMKNGRFVRELL